MNSIESIFCYIFYSYLGSKYAAYSLIYQNSNGPRKQITTVLLTNKIAADFPESEAVTANFGNIETMAPLRPGACQDREDAGAIS